VPRRIGTTLTWALVRDSDIKDVQRLSKADRLLFETWSTLSPTDLSESQWGCLSAIRLRVLQRLQRASAKQKKKKRR